MKLKWVTFYILVCIVTFSIGIYAGMRYENKNAQKYVLSKAQEEAVETKNETLIVEEEIEEPEVVEEIFEESFILYASDNGINLYKIKNNGETEFISEYEADIASLPSTDYQNLCKGINVKSREEALRLIEDFVS